MVVHLVMIAIGLGELSAKVNAGDKNGATPLHLAAWKGHSELVTTLLSEGADSNAQDRAGWTPLHWAAFKGRSSAAAALISGGADETITDHSGFNWRHVGMPPIQASRPRIS
eukprot:SAG11_NODE_1169_length_5616_cov_44.787566_5_plen_112_part_00